MDPNFFRKIDPTTAKIKLSRSNVFSEIEVFEILDKIKESFSFNTREEAATAIAVLFQQGGTARACDGNMTISIFEKNVKLATVRKILKDMNYARGERKLARSIAQNIFEVCVSLKIPGNLSQKIKRQGIAMETLSIEQEAWLSDFQTLNENLPPVLRSYIEKTFEVKQPKQQPTKKKK